MSYLWNVLSMIFESMKGLSMKCPNGVKLGVNLWDNNSNFSQNIE